MIFGALGRILKRTIGSLAREIAPQTALGKRRDEFYVFLIFTI